MIHTDPKHLVARDQAYREHTESRPTALDRPTIAVHLPQWQPLPGDITEADALHAFLSPEVRRFAIVMEARLRGNDLDRNEHDRPRLLHQRMVRESPRLLAALMHPSVTDNLGRPLPADHPDRNPRRVANVLREAASVACGALLVADACGALEASEERG